MDKPEERMPITGEHPVLVALQGPLEGKRWFLKDLLIVGREPECSVMIEDRQVSRQHARLTNHNNACSLEDLGSKNGTHLNGRDVVGALPPFRGQSTAAIFLQIRSVADTDQTPVGGEQPTAAAAFDRMSKSLQVGCPGITVNG